MCILAAVVSELQDRYPWATKTEVLEGYGFVASPSKTPTLPL